MNTTWLVLDMNYLCHRAFYALGQLSYKEVPTQVIFGVLRDILVLKDRFQTEQLVFCFDLNGHKLRREIFSGYKAKRKPMTDEQISAKAELEDQIRLLRKLYLPQQLDHPNVFYHDGYEADDIIASVTAELPKDEEAIIVSADEDLYQCLRDNVKIFNPREKKIITKESFEEQKGIKVEDWPYILAIAGGHDDIPGVPGVGETTALQYMRDELKDYSPKYQAIIKSNWDKQFLPIVKLPFIGTPKFHTVPYGFPYSKWKLLCDSLGMGSLQAGRAVTRERAIIDG